MGQPPAPPRHSHTHQQEVGWGLAESPNKAHGPLETRGGQPGAALLSAPWGEAVSVGLFPKEPGCLLLAW